MLRRLIRIPVAVAEEILERTAGEPYMLGYLKGQSATRHDLAALVKHLAWDGVEPLEDAYARLALGLEDALS